MQRKKKLSGAQRSKKRTAELRDRMREEGVLLSAVRIRRLNSVDDWEQEIAHVYRQARRGEMLPEDGTKFVFIARLGSELARYREERVYLENLMKQLTQLREGKVTFLPRATDDDPDPDPIPLIAQE